MLNNYSSRKLRFTFGENVSYALLFIFVLCISSCENVERVFPKVSFDAPLPGENKDLTQILGEQIALKAGADTFKLRIVGGPLRNMITDEKSSDTIFNGTVVEYNGVYYFNQQLNDTSYWIYAALIQNNLVRGVGRGWEQTLLIQQRIEKGEYPQMVKYISADKRYIRLHPIMSSVPSMFAEVIQELPVDTLLKDWKFIPRSDTLWVHGQEK